MPEHPTCETCEHMADAGVRFNNAKRMPPRTVCLCMHEGAPTYKQLVPVTHGCILHSELEEAHTTR